MVKTSFTTTGDFFGEDVMLMARNKRRHHLTNCPKCGNDNHVGRAKKVKKCEKCGKQYRLSKSPPYEEIRNNPGLFEMLPKKPYCKGEFRKKQMEVGA